MTRDEILSIAYSIGTVGEAWWLDDEDLMSFVTAIAPRLTAKIDAAPQPQPKQEPGYTTTRNAWTGRATYKCNLCGEDDFKSEHAAAFHQCQKHEPEPSRWVSLTEDDIDKLGLTAATKSDIQDIDAALREKNGGGL